MSGCSSKASLRKTEVAGADFCVLTLTIFTWLAGSDWHASHRNLRFSHLVCELVCSHINAILIDIRCAIKAHKDNAGQA